MLTHSLFEEIELMTADARRRLEETPVVIRCLQGQIERETYFTFLVEAYHHVKHTVPLLMACGSRLPERLEWMREAIVTYIDEEVGHQEWILNDLQVLGGDKEAIRNGVPSRPTELLVSYAYDTVMRVNPLGMFGMVYTLEKTSSTLATLAASQISDALELPASAMTYLVSHGSLDVGHMKHFEALVNRLEHDADKNAILHSVPVFYELYTDIFRSLPAPGMIKEGQCHAA